MLACLLYYIKRSFIVEHLYTSFMLKASANAMFMLNERAIVYTLRFRNSKGSITVFKLNFVLCIHHQRFPWKSTSKLLAMTIDDTQSQSECCYYFRLTVYQQTRAGDFLVVQQPTGTALLALHCVTHIHISVSLHHI